MKTAKTRARDPTYGMDVGEATALHAEHDGQTFFFCCEHCRERSLSAAAGAKPEEIIERAQ